MNSKLTLSLDTLVIARAKTYARTNSTSLSKLIEFYLSSLTSSGLKDGLNASDSSSPEIKITPLVASLSGVLGSKESSGNPMNWKKDYAKHLEKKYLVKKV
jgi:hypothetical protein